MKTDPLLNNKLRVTQADRKRLLPHLSGWNVLSTFLAADILSEDDLRKMILIEAEGAKRPPLIDKLVGAYLSKLRRRVIRELRKELT